MFTSKINRKKRDLFIHVSFDTNKLRKLANLPQELANSLFSQGWNSTSFNEPDGEPQGDPTPTPPDGD